ncbi:EthD family reductase [Rhodococcus sp. HM1]|uniref:EthD family reductase n=1 Tax=Rhodococcus sp. HM1 TaxID=2937759 RepID=UPI00200A8004|nr:EthD family reductase [Rhodococcus sp. HM1]MCK8670949.1 EthD family reductase [Rhodococcus sp. HM1]
MTCQISVCYGVPKDPKAFDEYYRTTHIPLAAKVPGLSGFAWGKCKSLDGSAPAHYAVAYLQFDTEDDLKKGLASPEMREAGRDLRNFATGGSTMFTQQLETSGA